jgi:hypothetical protein
MGKEVSPEMINLALERSAGHPIFLYLLISEDFEEHGRHVLGSVLAPHAYRIELLHLFHGIPPFTAPLTGLKYFGYCAPNYTAPIDPIIWLEKSPLVSVELCRCPSTSLIPVDAARGVTTLVSDFIYTFSVTQMSAFPNVLNAKMYAHETEIWYDRMHSIEIPQLETFTLIVTPYFLSKHGLVRYGKQFSSLVPCLWDSLGLPSLLTLNLGLELEQKDHYSKWQDESFREFISISNLQHQLQKLTIDGFSMSDESLIRVMELLPALRELTFIPYECDGAYNSVVTPQLLSRLIATPVNDFVPEPFLLPKLTCLRLWLVSAPQYSVAECLKEIVLVAQSRLGDRRVQTGAARLEELELLQTIDFDDQAQAMEIEKLCVLRDREGLRPGWKS